MNEIPVEHPRREFTTAELSHVCEASETAVVDAAVTVNATYFYRPIDKCRVYARKMAVRILTQFELPEAALDVAVFTTKTSPLWAVTAVAAAHHAKNEAMGDPQAASEIPASAMADTAEFNINK
jgi:hypothetical protein